MAKAKGLAPHFQATVKLTIELSVDMKSKTLEEALIEARSLKVTDVVDLGEHGYNDGDINVIGVFSY